MPKILRTRQAELDLAAIWSYIAADNREAADRMIRRIDERFHLLLRDPNMGDSLDRFRPGLRATAVGQYVIYFRPVAEDVEVYRVLHGAQQGEGHL